MLFAEVMLDLGSKGIHREAGESGVVLRKHLWDYKMAALQADVALVLGQAGSEPPLARAGHPVWDTTCLARMVTLTRHVTWFASK